MTIATTLRHALPAASAVSTGYTPNGARYVGAGTGVADEWTAMVTSDPHVAFAGAN